MENIIVKYKNLLIGLVALGAVTTITLITMDEAAPRLRLTSEALISGDSILFERGQTYYGQINVGKSNAFIGSYGEGEKPVISGFYQIENFTSLGGNIYESEAVPGGLSTLNLVTVNGVVTGMGRYPNLSEPNAGYLTIDAVGGKTSITDAALPTSVNWAGADVVIRSERWVLDRMRITSHNNHTLNYSGGVIVPTINYGYFIENDPKTLNKNGEWYWNPSTKKLRMYWEGSLPIVKLSTKEFGINSSNKSNVSITDLTFEGFNVNTINFNSGTSNSVTNSTIKNSGSTGIFVFNSTSFKIENDSILNSLNNSVDLAYGTTNSIFRKCYVDSTYQIAGMGGSGQAKGLAANLRGEGTVAEYNEIFNSGFTGIYLSAVDNIAIRNNHIKGYCSIKDDGAGIYTWTGGSSRVINKGRVISGNIIENGIGAPAGTDGVGLFANSSFGFYPDVNSSNILFDNNTLKNCGRAAVYMRPLVNNIEVTNNTLLNTQYLLFVVRDGTRDCYSNIIKNNIFLSPGPLQVKFDNYKGSLIPSVGIIDDNTYVNYSNALIAFSIRSNKYTFSQWISATNFDDHSVQKILSTTDVIKTVSTAEKSLMVDLGNYVWRDLNNKIFVNPLQPYTSAVLIRGEEIEPEPAPNIAPVVSISSDNATYTAPARIILTAEASDTDGTISKVEFLFNSKHLYTPVASPWRCVWSNVPKGNYVFTAKATDNSGNVTTSSSLTVTVK